MKTCRQPSNASTPSTDAGRVLVLDLDFRLPTWNQILGMSLSQRQRCKRLVHALTSTCIASAVVSPISMGSRLSGCSTPSSRLEYYETIGLSVCGASRSLKSERTVVVIKALENENENGPLNSAAAVLFSTGSVHARTCEEPRNG